MKKKAQNENWAHLVPKPEFDLITPQEPKLVKRSRKKKSSVDTKYFRKRMREISRDLKRRRTM